MTFGLKRYHESGQSHFITFSCYRRTRKFKDSALRDLFIQSLERTRVRYGIRIYGYVVMPEHVHLLVSEPDKKTLSIAIQSLKLSVSKLATKDKNAGPSRFWQKRYYDRNVGTYDEFVEKIKYIHRNPVKRGLVRKPEEWQWSSFLHYANGDAGSIELETEWTAKKRMSAAN